MSRFKSIRRGTPVGVLAAAILLQACASRPVRRDRAVSTATRDQAAVHAADGHWYIASGDHSGARLHRPLPGAQRSRDRGAARTVAVVSLGTARAGDPAVLERVGRHLELLVPDAVVVLGSRDGWHGQPAWHALEQRLVETVGQSHLLMLPGQAMPTDTALVALHQISPTLIFLHVRGDETDGRQNLVERAATPWQDVLRDRLADLPPSLHIVCFVDAPLWERGDGTLWATLATVLRKSGHDVTVISGEADRFSWWRGDDFTFIAVPSITNRFGMAQDVGRGKVPGYLWIQARPDAAPRFAVLAESGLLGLTEFARERQIVVQRLANNLHATAIDDLSPFTDVTFTNPTGLTLRFAARWEFRQAAVGVTPRIREFELQPGQTFRQQFRFTHDGTSPLKHLQPTLVLTTSLKLNGYQEVEIATSPWCRAVGRVDILTESPVLDGVPPTDRLTGHEIGLPAHVVTGRRHWNGPGDISGRVFVGIADAHVYIAVGVTDDQRSPPSVPDDAADSVTIYTDLRTADERRAADDVRAGALLGVRVLRDGTVQALPGTVYADPTVLQSYVTDLAGGYTVEMLIPRDLFADAMTEGPLRFDVALTDSDPGEAAVKRLFLSGRPDTPFPDPDLYALFLRPEETEAPTAQ